MIFVSCYVCFMLFQLLYSYCFMLYFVKQLFFYFWTFLANLMTRCHRNLSPRQGVLEAATITGGADEHYDRYSEHRPTNPSVLKEHLRSQDIRNYEKLQEMVKICKDSKHAVDRCWLLNMNCLVLSVWPAFHSQKAVAVLEKHSDPAAFTAAAARAWDLAPSITTWSYLGYVWHIFGTCLPYLDIFGSY